MAQCRLPKPKDPVAASKVEVIELLFAYVDRLRAHFDSVAKAHDLTPVQAKVVLFLGQPERMRCVADGLGCDPSNVTGVVDRLEERGLILREEGKPDRRVTLLKETPRGRKLREKLEAVLFEDVPGMDRLTSAQVAGLKEALARLGAEDVVQPSK